MEILDTPTRSSTTPGATAMPPHLGEPSQLGATVEHIVRACALVDALAQSVCLRCKTRVIAMDSQRRATMYCSAMFRDIETEITACTAFVPDIPNPDVPE